jgi:hypothetical protein
VTRKTAAACRLLAKATAAAGKKQRRLLGQAGKQWRAADKALKGRKAKRTLSTGCLRALRARVTDGLVRTKNATR